MDGVTVEGFTYAILKVWVMDAPNSGIPLSSFAQFEGFRRMPQGTSPADSHSGWVNQGSPLR
jgi:hypothetical protein